MIGMRTCEIPHRFEKQAHGWEQGSKMLGRPCVDDRSCLQHLEEEQKGR